MSRVYKLDTTSLVGKVFHDLTVTGRADRSQYESGKATPWICKCKCGNESKVLAGHLRSGESRSCGCSHLADTDPITAFKILYSRYKSHAKAKNRVFDLTVDEFTSIVTKNCFYCNTPPSQQTKAPRKLGTSVFLYNGIDRISSSHGYTNWNSISCCSICNRAKSDMTFSEFKDWIEKLVQSPTF